MTLSLLLIIEAFCILMLIICIDGHTDKIFIYDFLLLTSVSICGPMYYVGICALTEPKGSSPRQRRILLIPLIFIIGLVAGSIMLGTLNYESMCRKLYKGIITWNDSSFGWKFMFIWHNLVYIIILLVVNSVIIYVAHRKLNIYRIRYNSFYADRIGYRLKRPTVITIFAWLYLPLSVGILLLMYFQPTGSKNIVILLSILLTIEKSYFGYYIYNLNNDARYLNSLLVSK